MWEVFKLRSGYYSGITSVGWDWRLDQVPVSSLGWLIVSAY